MILNIVQYGDPVLRKKGRRVEPLPLSADDPIRELAADMLETMYDAEGVGLAAQQVGEALQLAVVDVSHDPDCISYLRVNGSDCELADLMPLVFLNPEIELDGDRETAVEGCLSFDDLRADIRRPSELTARLQTLDGEVLEIETDGLLARAIQHETDHLFGVLFIDRMSSARKMSLRRQLKEMKADYLAGGG
jgi:peptide deformylase